MIRKKIFTALLIGLLVTAGVIPLFAQESVEIRISADNIAFNKDELTVPAGAEVTLVFNNKEAVPHNVAVYETDAMEEIIFQGEVFRGPRKVTYTFTAPDEPGTYFFVCDVHPRTMTGDFVVE